MAIFRGWAKPLLLVAARAWRRRFAAPAHPNPRRNPRVTRCRGCCYPAASHFALGEFVAMRWGVGGTAIMSMMLALSGCVDYDVVDPVQRAELGGALGATAGAALGATFAINPGFGALIGAAGGAALGAAAGYATAEPAPSYAPVALPRAAVIPGFYDSWPPGYGPPAFGSQTPPPPRPG